MAEASLVSAARAAHRGRVRTEVTSARWSEVSVNWLFRRGQASPKLPAMCG